MTESQLHVELSQDKQTLYCHGDWLIRQAVLIGDQIQGLHILPETVSFIDVSAVSFLDTTGALLLLEFKAAHSADGHSCELVGVSDHLQSLLDLVEEERIASQKKTTSAHPQHNDFYVIGKNAIHRYRQWLSVLAFIGELLIVLWQNLSRPLHLAWHSIIENIDRAGFRALPIIGLMSFLIGLVLAYQLSTQLQTYGADIFVVDITGIGILREFGPLITAIVMAGRTSTSFAALIGTMKINEELDALSTMGITPMSHLIVPRIIATLVIMPLLVVWADIFGIFGSMFMSKVTMGISYVSFIDRFHHEVPATEYVLGLVKTPFFALIIAGVGCLQGLLVGDSADSVGVQTTKAAVQAIFMVIIADAAFSIIFSWMGI